MPTFSFEGNEHGSAVTADVKDGGRLIDVCDEVHAAVVFSCRSASCGTCRIDVLEGGELLTPPGRDEHEVLEIFAAAPAHRLACQAVARPGPGLIRIRWVND